MLATLATRSYSKHQTNKIHLLKLQRVNTMKGLVKISDLLGKEKDTHLANVMQAVKAHEVRNGTVVSNKTADVILKSFQNNLPNQAEYEYYESPLNKRKCAWFELSQQRKIELWAEALIRVTDYFGNDKSTSEFTRLGLWTDAAAQIIEKHKDILPFEFKHYLTTIPSNSIEVKKQPFTSYTITFLLNLVYDYKIERNLFIRQLNDYRDRLEREKTIKLTETVSLPNYEKLKGIEASKLPINEVIRARNDKEFTEFFKTSKDSKETHLQAFNLFWKTINDGDGMQVIEMRNMIRLLNNTDNIEVERNINGDVLTFKITNGDLRRRYEVCFSKQVLFNFINQNKNGKETKD